MTFYRVCELVLSSNTALPEVTPIEAQQADCTFELLAAREARPDPCEWFHRWGPSDEDTWTLFGKIGPDYLLRFPNLADFLVSVDGRNIRCHPAPDTPFETVRHLLLDQVLPLVLSGRGELVLHASAVSTPEGGFALIGSSGQGKSTVAAYFALGGSPLVTDDCLLIRHEGGQILGVPSYPGLRLWAETIRALTRSRSTHPRVAHYTRKKRFAPAGGVALASAAVPLRRVYFLDPQRKASASAPISIQPLTPREALVELVKYAYILDVTDPGSLRGLFDRLSRLALSPLLFSLRFPHDYSRLPELREAVLRDLSTSPETRTMKQVKGRTP